MTATRCAALEFFNDPMMTRWECGCDECEEFRKLDRLDAEAEFEAERIYMVREWQEDFELGLVSA